MLWEQSYRTDPKSREIADRHYNRQSIGATNFAPPGRCLVLRAESDRGRTLWITSWPYARYVKHRWAGAWVCSAFRNEDAGKASDLIADAVSASLAYYGAPPLLGMVTFLDTTKVQPIRRRGELHWGYCWERVGFRHVGFTQSGLMAFQLKPQDMPGVKAPQRFVAPHRDFRSFGQLALDAWLAAP